jgi:hypothetical protein
MTYEPLKVINLFAGPGAGKSTTMAAIFSSMKRKRLNVEMCPEWVKGASWEDRKQTFTDQGYILGKQNYLLHRLRGQVDCATSKTASWTGEIKNIGSSKTITSDKVTVDRDINAARGIFLRALGDHPEILRN